MKDGVVSILSMLPSPDIDMIIRDFPEYKNRYGEIIVGVLCGVTMSCIPQTSVEEVMEWRDHLININLMKTTGYTRFDQIENALDRLGLCCEYYPDEFYKKFVEYHTKYVKKLADTERHRIIREDLSKFLIAVGVGCRFRIHKAKPEFQEFMNTEYLVETVDEDRRHKRPTVLSMVNSVDTENTDYCKSIIKVFLENGAFEIVRPSSEEIRINTPVFFPTITIN